MTGASSVVRGYRIFSRSQGDGPTLLFFHGFPTSSLDWELAVRALSPRYRCVTFDFLGFGSSDKPRIGYDFDLQAEVVEAVARQHGITRATVVAHDYGVTAAQELLARRAEGRAPFELEKLVLLNGGLNPALHRARTIQKLLASPLGPVLSPLVSKRSFARSLRALFVHPEAIDIDVHWAALEKNGGRAVVPRLLRYMEERRRKADRWISALVKADVPLSFFWGLRDPVSGAHMLEWARRARPDAKVEALDVGHYPQLEAPEAFARNLSA